MKKILILLLCLYFLTGCYNYRELNDLAIISAVLVDFNDDTNEYELKVQLVNPKKEQDASSSNEPAFVIYDAHGSTVQDAFRQILETAPSKMYGSHTEILIISENVANNHFEKILDFFIRDPEIRTQFDVLIAKKNNDDELNITTPLINLSSKNILTLLNTNSKNLGQSTPVTFDEIASDYLNPYKEFLLPSLTIIGSEEKGENKDNLSKTNADSKLQMVTLGVFKDTKLQGYLTKKESIGINYILGNIKSSLVSHECNKDEKVVVEVTSSKTKIDVDVKNKKVIINIKPHAILSELNCKIDISNEDVMNKMVKNLNDEVEEIVKDAIYKIQHEYKTDVLGIRELFYKKDSKYFKDHYSNWYNDIYENIKFEVNCDMTVFEKGNTLGGIKYEKDKNK